MYVCMYVCMYVYIYDENIGSIDQNIIDDRLCLSVLIADYISREVRVDRGHRRGGEDGQ